MRSKMHQPYHIGRRGPSNSVYDYSQGTNASWHAFITLAVAHTIFLYSKRNNTYLNAVYFDVGRRLLRQVPTNTTLVTRVNDESLFIY